MPARTSIVLVALILGAAAVPCPARAEEGADVGVVVRGVVERAPAATASEPPPPRYRSRRARGADADVPSADCGCDPGRFAVVYLTGDDLPPVVPPPEPPRMTQRETRFEPSVLAIPVGATVDFPNLDPFFHNVFSYSSVRPFDLGRYPAGESESVTFPEPGIVPIFCEIHYSMRAYVHVLETPYFAVSDDQRTFEIGGVRPGEYILHVWQENLPELARPIQVGAQPLDLRIR